MAQFTVVIPLYNKAAEIRATLNSVFAQTFSDFKVIVIDDGSTDHGAQIVKEFTDTRLRFIGQKNQGVGPARNTGVKEAKSTFIAFLDADDYWYPEHLENLNTLIHRFPQAQWMATAYEKAFTPNLIKPVDTPLRSFPQGWQGAVPDYFAMAKKDAPAWTSALCFSKDFFQNLGGFDPAITMGAGEDTDLWIRAALTQPMYWINSISARHLQFSSNRVSHAPTLKRHFIDLDQYENRAQDHKSLKIYLDLNRYSIGLKYQMAGDQRRAESYFNALDRSSLNALQRILIGLPGGVLRFGLSAQRLLAGFGLRLSAFGR
ncbi:MAG: glycosyltransferase family 2 protein [Flavobacteriaceae bacterium]|nr:glycosyltransferase family 2 protein [Flavobacteriaceae bacterium]